MFAYRPDQGVYARGTAFWALVAFAGVAASRFYYQVQAFGDWSRKHLLTEKIPVLGMYLTPALLVGVALFTLLAFAVWKVVNWPKLADLMIETESEMKKVTWPSFDDSKKSSLVVIGCVIFMLVFLSAVDFILRWLFMDLIYQ